MAVSARAEVWHWLAAGALTLATLIVAIVYGTRVAGGADAYGYLSQADLWLAGKSVVEQPFAGEVPWPAGPLTFSPLGYRPAFDPPQSNLVPTYAFGLPLLFAAAKALGGQAAMFWVVPIAAAILVLFTFLLGCRLASPTAGVIGAWLVAASPTVLLMAMQPMSDVPAAAAWAVTFYVLLGASRRSAAIAGATAGVAILVRPNLAPIAAVMGGYYLLALSRAKARRQELIRAALFSIGVVAAAAWVAIRFNHLYGSPFASGYGPPDALYSTRNIPANIRNYFVWLLASQTPLVTLGLAAVLFPLRTLWPASSLRARLAAAAFVALLWALYLPYIVFDAWWYMRFLLPGLPFILLGTGAVAAWLLERAAPRIAPIISGVLIVLGLAPIWFGRSNGIFHVWKAEARYPTAAAMLQRHTDDNSLILSMQHSGSVRYYGGRVTLRYDLLDPNWFGPGLEWLEVRGVHPYLLVDDWEMPDFRRHHSSPRAIDVIQRPPLAVYEGHGGQASVYLFDLAAAPAARSTEHVPGIRSTPDTANPAPLPKLVFRPEGSSVNATR